MHCKDHGAIHRAYVHQQPQHQGVQSQQSSHLQACRQAHSGNHLQNPFNQCQVISVSNLQGSFTSGQVSSRHARHKSHKASTYSQAFREETRTRSPHQNLHSRQVSHLQHCAGQCQLPIHHLRLCHPKLHNAVVLKYSSRRRICAKTRHVYLTDLQIELHVSTSSPTSSPNPSTFDSTSSRTLTSTLSFRLGSFVSRLKSTLSTWT